MIALEETDLRFLYHDQNHCAMVSIEEIAAGSQGGKMRKGSKCVAWALCAVFVLSISGCGKRYVTSEDVTEEVMDFFYKNAYELVVDSQACADRLNLEIKYLNVPEEMEEQVITTDDVKFKHLEFSAKGMYISAGRWSELDMEWENRSKNGKLRQAIFLLPFAVKYLVTPWKEVVTMYGVLRVDGLMHGEAGYTAQAIGLHGDLGLAITVNGMGWPEVVYASYDYYSGNRVWKFNLPYTTKRK